MRIRAVYENGVFKPLEDVPIKEGIEVDVYPRSDEKGNGGKPKKSITDFAFFGMWKDRTTSKPAQNMLPESASTMNARRSDLDALPR